MQTHTVVLGSTALATADLVVRGAVALAAGEVGTVARRGVVGAVVLASAWAWPVAGANSGDYPTDRRP